MTKDIWRCAKADRAAVIVDAAAYYEALYHAFNGARRDIWILGWDTDPRIRLQRGEAPTHGTAGETLGELLIRLLERNPKLRVQVLTWDFAMVYAAERDWTPLVGTSWPKHRRLTVEMDGATPLAGSQHQKIVVVDDQIAFSGGIDLAKVRWDTPEHRPADPRRVDPDGATYPPFHDIQMCVDAQAAAALGELVRERWQRAGHAWRARPVPPGDYWPDNLTADFRDCQIQIARTYPRYRDQAAVDEVQRSYCRQIAAARDWIYIENQYLSSQCICDALIERLRGDDPPELVMVLPLRSGGWLEEVSMGLRRRHFVHRLVEAAEPDRLRLYYPHIPDIGEDYLTVHAKFMVIDDTLLRVGSANLSNRSMGLDSECDLTIEGASQDVGSGVAGVLCRLLAEHLDGSAAALEQHLADTTSLIATVERFNQADRGLRPVPDLDSDLPPLPAEATDWLDPERPLPPDQLLTDVFSRSDDVTGGRSVLMPLLILAALAALAAVWRWSPLAAWLTPDNLRELAAPLASHPAGAPLAAGAMGLAAVFGVPVTALVVAVSLLFTPLAAFTVALTGSLLGALGGLWLGRILGRGRIRRLAGSRLGRWTEQLRDHAFWSVLTVRIVPVAPFAVINLVAGVSRIATSPFLLATAAGMAPGILAVTLFTDGLLRVLRDPTPGSWLLLGTILGGVIGGLFVVQRWAKSQATGSGPG